jgi:DNA modification methylase
MKDKEKAYADKIKGAQFIEFLRKRLIFLREILAEDGSIYVHLDQKKGHYIKIILDEVFGEHNFKNEIIWKRTFNVGSSKGLSNKFPVNTDVLYWYTKSENYIYNKQYRPFSQGALKRYDKEDENGRFMWVPLKTVSLEKLERLRASGEIREEIGLKYSRYKKYLDEETGVVVDNIWDDIGQIATHPTGQERVNYPTQKPETLLDRIIKTTTNEGDIVIDCFLGSGTTTAVAGKLNRKWIGIDCGKLAIYTCQNRLIQQNYSATEKQDDRNQIQRLSDDSVFNTRGLIFITEKAKKGQLTITNDFLQKLHELLLEVHGLDDFALVCPADKFLITNFEEDETGLKTIKKDHITYKISYIEPKVKEPKPKPLKAKSFVLYNAGIYDKEKILEYNWPQYRDFVMKLFEVRPHPHDILGFKVDGYLGVYPAYIWNYPERKNVAIDYEYVKQLHDYLNGRAGDRMYIIVPKDSINFMEDEIKHGDTVYTFLKVPASVLIRLIEAHNSGKTDALASLKQPRSESDVNEVIDSFGFDFVSQPVVDYDLITGKQSHGLLEEDKMIIRLKEFRSKGLLYSPEDFRNFETLSLILLDYNYANDVFTMDEHFWAADVAKEDSKTVDIVFDPDRWTEGNLAVILIDIYGNEKSLVFTKNDFDHGRKSTK